ncbi:MAG: GNAT family N-acetyltransferase [Rudaea sp.]|uniref:GNAT family N-acetyltransferase n=1 Tax=unclassified Rudaea TaxID=2627037 RepID=UPI0010F57558|nr:MULTISPECIES: N-acetyltransferase [unclassified Rudaea]MBN8885546.1 GNAT family N-acetyltransferase [Rudaea sp.]MBR0346258.1 GNAT family N-acetyltransferase [Rudaea sp.]
MSSSHTDISIRPAVDADLGALLALERASFTTDHLSLRQYRQHLHSATATVLAAVDADGLLGKAVVFYRQGSDIARLYSIAVAERARGRGIAKSLLAAVETAAHQRDCSRLRLEVRKDNAAAIALYERLGFQRFGEKHGFYEDGADAWRYQKVIG